MNGKNSQPNFFEEQLYETQRALFAAKSVKQIKFLQKKIKYLQEKIKESR